MLFLRSHGEILIARYRQKVREINFSRSQKSGVYVYATENHVASLQ